MQPLVSLIVLGFRNFDATTRVCLESLVPGPLSIDIGSIFLDGCSSMNCQKIVISWC